jgi:hypothetical protein
MPNVRVYYSSDFLPGNLREVNLDSYVLDLSGLSSVRDITNKAEFAHPVLTLKIKVLEIINIKTGEYISYEVNGVVILRARITRVNKEWESYRVILETSDMLINLKNYTIDDVWNYLELTNPPHNTWEYRYNEEEDWGYHWIQLIWVLKLFLAVTGINYNYSVMEDLWDVPSGYYYNTTEMDYNKLYFNIELFRAMGKSSNDDTESANAYEVFSMIMRVLNLKYQYQDDLVIINRINDVVSGSTIKNYKDDEISDIGLRSKAELIDVTESWTPASFEFYRIFDYINLNSGVWSGTKTIEIKTEGSKTYNLEFPSNFVIFTFGHVQLYGLHHIPQTPTCFPWDCSGSIWTQIYNRFSDKFTPGANEVFKSFQIDLPTHFNKDYNRITTILKNNLTTSEYYALVEED